MASSAQPNPKRVSSDNPEHQVLVAQINRIIAAFEQRIAALEAKPSASS